MGGRLRLRVREGDPCLVLLNPLGDLFIVHVFLLVDHVGNMGAALEDTPRRKSEGEGGQGVKAASRSPML